MNVRLVSPDMPSHEEYSEQIKALWDSKHLSNSGQYHENLQDVLSEEFSTKVLLYSNGHLALEAALSVLPIGSEVILPAYTFASTAIAVVNRGLKPVFCDVGSKVNDVQLDVNKVEKLINEKTSAILGVHVYGLPCNVEDLISLSKTHNLKLIYDGAHAFGVKFRGKHLLSYGDYSMCSFHATKVFNTIEGGGLFTNHETETLEKFKNFGQSVQNVNLPATNAKLNEFQAIFGLLNFNKYKENVKKRLFVADAYTDLLESFSDKLSLLNYRFDDFTWNGSYYPIFLNENVKEKVSVRLQEKGIQFRPYFTPSLNMTDAFKSYCGDESEFENSIKRSNEVICLPIHTQMTEEQIHYVVEAIKSAL